MIRCIKLRLYEKNTPREFVDLAAIHTFTERDRGSAS
jgi:hypothetical protein